MTSKYFISKFLSFCLPFIILFASCEKQTDPAYLESIQQWRENRLQSLTREDGWLSLVGLYWLHQGENSFGGAPSNDLQFPPEKSPDYMGAFVLEDGIVTMQMNQNVTVYHNNEPVSSIQLNSDAQEFPTKITYGSLTWYIIKRGDRLGVRLKDRESESRKNFKGIDYFEIDPKWRLTATFQPQEPPKVIEVPTFTGNAEFENSPGTLYFTINGNQLSLDPIGDNTDDRWFIIFSDETNGEQTYGAGRFLYIDAPGDDGKTIIDFNKSYNPPCAFTPYATCPLPPEQNHLPLPVTAGEKNYHGYEH